MFRIFDGREAFYQWDTNQKLIVEDATVSEVHFCTRACSEALVVEVKELDGARVAEVPNILLQKAFDLKAYAFCGDGYTVREEYFKITERSKPTDYIYTETEVKNWEKYGESIAALEEKTLELEEENNKANNEIQEVKNIVNGVTLTYEGINKPNRASKFNYFKDGVNLPALYMSFFIGHHTFTYNAETGEADITWKRTNLPPCDYSFNDGNAWANFKCDFTEAYILLDASVFNPEVSGVYPMPLTEINSACEDLGGFLVFDRWVYSPMTSSQLTWEYVFRFVFPDEATRDAFNEELTPVIRNGWMGFAESYTYTPAPEAIVSEVIKNA